MHQLIHCIFVLATSTAVLAVSNHGRQLLKSLPEYYLFKPFHDVNQHGPAGKINTLHLKTSTGIHLQETIIHIIANNTDYELVLTLNKDFLPETFTYSFMDEDGNDFIEKPTPQEINNCYYHGFVKDIPGSTVVVSTCGGLKGTMILSSDVLVFEPIDEEDLTHILYRPPTQPHQCGNSPHESFIDIVNPFAKHTRLKRAVRDEKKYIELMVVADKKEFDRYKTREKLFENIKNIVNHLDALYKKIDLRVVLLHVEVWDKGDKIVNVNTNAQTVLNNFLKYRKDRIRSVSNDSPWRYTDNAQLLYGGDFEGSTVGMATVSSMCGFRSGGVNMDHGVAVNTASTLAHEMGHNLGMSHDTSDCKCDSRTCVMAPSVSYILPDAWTDCSSKYLEQGYEYGTGNCLLNVPESSRVFGGPACGNGIIEKGEQCDCGLPDECTSNCCNATTCQLYKEADCDAGACCTASCKFKSCKECRETANECDIAEYCSGTSAYCPGNIYKNDGQSCLNGAGVCYGGVCKTHEMQCQEIWGSGATNGDDQCYLSVNKKGDVNGNCGWINGRFRACTPENAMCGKLLCSGGEQFPLIGRDRYFYKNTFRDFVCKTLSSTNSSSDVGDTGLVSDGTKCGDGKICFDGECSDMSLFTGSCTSDCNGHGVCNNFGNCHCEYGWAPPDCSRKGNGGSFDSGPICVSSVDTATVLLLVFFLVILPITLTGIAVIWWRYCGGRPKMYAWRKNRENRKANLKFSKVPKKDENQLEHTYHPRQQPPVLGWDSARQWEENSKQVTPPTYRSKQLPVLGLDSSKQLENNSKPAMPSRPPPPSYNPPQKPINPPMPAIPSPSRNPARSAPAPPAKKYTVSNPPPPPPPPPKAVGAKPNMPQRPQQRNTNGLTDTQESPTTSIQDRIRRLQNNNGVC